MAVACLCCFFFAKIPLLAGMYYLNWPHVPLKYIRFFQLFSLSRLNTLVIISLQDSSITMALVSLQRQYAEENRALWTQGISRVQPNKHPLHCNLTRFTHCAPSCFVCALRQCLQFIQRLQLNFPLPLISSLSASQGKESIDSRLLCLSSAFFLAMGFKFAVDGGRKEMCPVGGHPLSLQVCI